MLGFCWVEVNALGPVHEYEVPPLEVRFNTPPPTTGLLLEALAVGFECTVTDVVALAVQPDAFVTFTIYVPAADVVTLLMLGFCNEEVNPLGPVHEYTVPPPELKFNVLPVQPALLETVAVGFAF